MYYNDLMLRCGITEYGLKLAYIDWFEKDINH